MPRIEVPGGTYFVTFCVRDRSVCNLASTPIGSIVVEALCHFNGQRYHLFDYTIMPDHVHVILQPLPTTAGATPPLHRILAPIKGWTAYRINRWLDRRGAIWQRRSYDHLIRNDADYREKARYIWENPLRQGLVDDPAHWPWWGRGHEG